MTMCSKKNVGTKTGQAIVISDNESIKHQTDNEKKNGCQYKQAHPTRYTTSVIIYDY